MVNLINSRKTDPFDRTKQLVSVIKNRLADDAIDTLKLIQNQKKRLAESKKACESYCQTDIIVRWEEDISKIKELEQNFKLCFNKLTLERETTKRLQKEAQNLRFQINTLHSSNLDLLSKNESLTKNATEAKNFYEDKISLLSIQKLNSAFSQLPSQLSKSPSIPVCVLALNIWREIMIKTLFILYKKPKVDITKQFRNTEVQATVMTQEETCQVQPLMVNSEVQAVAKTKDRKIGNKPVMVSCEVQSEPKKSFFKSLFG
jgi:hypothetical protein